MTEVAQTEAFMALDEMTVKNFIQRAAQHGAFKYWYSNYLLMKLSQRKTLPRDDDRTTNDDTAQQQQ